MELAPTKETFEAIKALGASITKDPSLSLAFKRAGLSLTSGALECRIAQIDSEILLESQSDIIQ